MQRVADPSSQPRASHRSIGARWSEEGSALEMADSGGIARSRRGTHDRADATGPCRCCATTVSCRAANCTSRGPAHAKSAHRWLTLKSCATCDRASTVLPRSPTDVPAPSGQRRCRMHPEHLLQAASGSHSGLQPRSDRTIALATGGGAIGGGVPDASLLLPAGRAHPVCIAQGRCSLHARRLTQIGRQRPL